MIKNIYIINIHVNFEYAIFYKTYQGSFFFDKIEYNEQYCQVEKHIYLTLH